MPPDVRAAYVYDPVMSRHVLRDDHPMRPVRLQHTFELLQAYGAFDGPDAVIVEPRPATEAELTAFHTQEYIDAVRRYADGLEDGGAARFGFSAEGDTPVYAGMYQTALISTGASVLAAELIAGGKVHAAFNPAGGLHHAAAGHASGFCIFNDPVVAISVLRARGLRVAYVDVDAHHGDGLQDAFYADAGVLTISIHESGRYLFPGTGEVNELGTGSGRGFSVNLPLMPYTDDEVYLEAFDAVVPPLIAAFKPDVLATQLGVDTYVSDPLTHLALTTNGYVQVVERLGGMGYPWLAFGGGGYDLDAVARCWTLAFGVMAGREWPDVLPAGLQGVAGTRLRDEPAAVDAKVQAEARRFVHARVDEVRASVFPFHGLH